jgi:hypothetical protein
MNFKACERNQLKHNVRYCPGMSEENHNKDKTLNRPRFQTLIWIWWSGNHSAATFCFLSTTSRIYKTDCSRNTLQVTCCTCTLHSSQVATLFHVRKYLLKQESWATCIRVTVRIEGVEVGASVTVFWRTVTLCRIWASQLELRPRSATIPLWLRVWFFWRGHLDSLRRSLSCLSNYTSTNIPNYTFQGECQHRQKFKISTPLGAQCWVQLTAAAKYCSTQNEGILVSNFK